MLETNKLYRFDMKHLIILFFAVLSFGTLSAQQLDEKEIKGKSHNYLYSDYLYGEATENTKDEAVKAAKSALLYEINREASKHPEWRFAKTIQADGVEYDFDKIELMRGSKYRVIAYIKKDSITAVFDKNTPKVKMSDNPATQVKTPPTADQPVKPQPVADTNVTPASETVQLKVEEPKVSATEQPQTDTVVTPVPKKVQADGLLGEILNATSYNEVLKILDRNKRTGKAVHGNMNTLTAPEKAYLLVYKESGEIVAILEKGSRNNRKDLLSGEIKEKEIQTQNQVIWFILF